MAKFDYPVHSVSELFPSMDEESYEALKADIAAHKQSEPIVLWKKQLIDGRHRLRACNELGIKPIVVDIPASDDPLAYVISHNLHRRHLSTSQRAMVAAKIATLSHGGDRKSTDQDANLRLETAASQLKVSQRSVNSAKQVLEHGAKAVQKAVEQGTLAVSAAAELATSGATKTEQTQAVKGGKESIKEVLKKPVRKKQGEAIGDEVEEDDIEDEPTIAEICDADNKAIESFCRAIVKQFEKDVPKIPWTQDSGRIESALASLKAGLTTLRGAKAVVCPACVDGRTEKGKCRYCKGHGYLPVYQADAIPEDAKL